MNFDTASRFVSGNALQLILCDSDFNVAAVSASADGLNIKKDENLFSLFPQYSDLLKKAQNELSLKKPYLSTNFELVKQISTIIFLPITEKEHFVGSFLYFMPNSLIADSAFIDYAPRVAEGYRSPANAILNLVNALAVKMEQEERYDDLKYLNEIAQNSYEILRLSGSVYSYYRLKAGKFPVRKQKTLLNTFLSDFQKSIAALLAKLKINIIFEDCSSSLAADIDIKAFTSMLLQLVKNCCVFSPQESNITIKLRKNGNNATIKITDEGAGIPAEVMPYVFEPFFTSYDIPLAEEAMGAGLGLPIAKEIIALHGGNIFIESTQNQGTSVLLSIPATKDLSGIENLNHFRLEYATDKFSDIYMLFSKICDLTFF